MNARMKPELLQPEPLGTLSNHHLDALEEETIFILREVAEIGRASCRERVSVLV